MFVYELKLKNKAFFLLCGTVVLQIENLVECYVALLGTPFRCTEFTHYKLIVTYVKCLLIQTHIVTNVKWKTILIHGSNSDVYNVRIGLNISNTISFQGGRNHTISTEEIQLRIKVWRTVKVKWSELYKFQIIQILY